MTCNNVSLFTATRPLLHNRILLWPRTYGTTRRYKTWVGKHPPRILQSRCEHNITTGLRAMGCKFEMHWATWGGRSMAGLEISGAAQPCILAASVSTQYAASKQIFCSMSSTGVTVTNCNFIAFIPFVSLSPNFQENVSEQCDDTQELLVIRHCRWEILSADATRFPCRSIVCLAETSVYPACQLISTLPPENQVSSRMREHDTGAVSKKTVGVQHMFAGLLLIN
jgi:hypothetical protein